MEDDQHYPERELNLFEGNVGVSEIILVGLLVGSTIWLHNFSG